MCPWIHDGVCYPCTVHTVQCLRYIDEHLTMRLELLLTLVLFSVFKDYAPSSRPCSEQNCSSGCTCTNVLELPYNRTVQLVLLNYNSPNEDMENHQVNIHGHDFSVVRIGYPEINTTTDSWIGNNDDIECDDTFCAQAHWRDGVVPALNLRDPPVRDVVTVSTRGYAVIRFRTLNPGFWYLSVHTQILAQEGGFNSMVGKHCRFCMHMTGCNSTTVLCSSSNISKQHRCSTAAVTTTITTIRISVHNI